MTPRHPGWLHFSGSLDEWIAAQARLGRKFNVSSSDSQNRSAWDASGKEVAIEFDFLDPTCCQYDPAFKLPE